MNNKMKYVFIPLLVVSLASCHRPVDDLYKAGQYETSSFESNFYHERRDFDTAFKDVDQKDIEVTKGLYNYHNAFDERISELREEDQVDKDGNILKWNEDEPTTDRKSGFGPYHSLYNNDHSFSDGYISKLYDGRVRCDGKVAKSRVQVDKRGYATYFPKALSTYKYFGIALRGATEDGNANFANEDPSNPIDKYYPHIDIQISFVIHSTTSGEYSKINFNVKDYPVRTNDYYTAFFFFYFDDVLKPEYGDNWNTILKDTIAMSFTFSLVNQRVTGKEYTDDATNKEKDHFALMLYEVMLPDSTWY